MNFAWEKYLELAEGLFKVDLAKTDEEARWRSAISRSYYYAFLIARNYLRDVEEHPPVQSGSTHLWVQEQFETILTLDSTETDKTRHKIYTILNRMHTNRKTADYEDSFDLKGLAPNLEKLTETEIKQAKKIKDLLNSLPHKHST